MKKLEQLLIFKINGCKYCIDSDLIVQILRVPEITKIPFTSKSIKGLCSIEGHIVPAFDTKQMICDSSSSIDMDSLKARVLTIKQNNTQLALIVEEVMQNIDVLDNEIEKSDNENEPVIGVFKRDDEIIQIISIDKLLLDVTMPDFTRNSKSTTSKTQKSEHLTDNKDLDKYLLFRMGDEDFAIEIDSIREIIVNTKDITPIANSSDDVIGMITLRDEVLVILDFRKHFNKNTEFSEKNRILVIKEINSYIGLLIDDIIDIKDISIDSIEHLPEKFRDKKVLGICNLDDSLVSVIQNSYLESLVKESDNSINKENSEVKVISKKDIDFIEVAIFSLSNEEFALDIDDVDEIIRYDNITPFPRTTSYLKGIINLRGEVVPILSLQKRLGFQENITEDSKILICSLSSIRVGFLVDNVSEIKEINLSLVKESDENDTLFSNVIILEDGNRIILKLNRENIFNFNDINNILKDIKEAK